MICIAALSILTILGIFSVRYRSLAKEAFHCVFLRVQFKPCETGFDLMMKSKITASLMRFPKLAKIWRKYFQVFSLIFVILLVISFYFSSVAIYNIVRYGTCDPDEPCALVSFPRRLLTPFSIPDTLEYRPAEIVFFYEEGCPNYERVTLFLEQRIKSNYPVNIREYDISEGVNVKLARQLAAAYNTIPTVPMIFVGDVFIHEYNRSALRKLEEAVRTALRTQAPSPLNRIEEYKETSSDNY
ncbi:MAG: hypothetical protein E3J23_01335 [Candidatus Stahlbacteria bacterium]|nr:MAG: hypothetical protein E3J23_01335 [Candidatus Stahlbacteria bacterium]